MTSILATIFSETLLAKTSVQKTLGALKLIPMTLAS